MNPGMSNQTPQCSLGAGTVSDMKLQLGFDVTDPTVSQEVFASNMEVVKDFLNNRKAGLDSLRYQSAVTGGGSNSVVNTNTNTNVVSTIGQLQRKTERNSLKKNWKNFHSNRLLSQKYRQMLVAQMWLRMII